jgi:3',5'-cyclic AMP phosphodiesterase CpdA
MVDWARTVHGIGDLHAGGIQRVRVTTMLDDVQTLPAPAAHLQIGDATERGLPDEDALARDWLDRLPSPVHTVLGNHDVMRKRRTAQEWAEAYGLDSPNQVIDLPFLRIVAPAPDRAQTAERSGTLSPETLAWLEGRLEDAGRDCWIACHWPLYKTVMGDRRKVFTSAMRSFYAKPGPQIRALLARHPNAKAWISGHTHSPLSAPGLISRVRLPRDRSIAAINLSAIVGVGKQRDPEDPICSLYLTPRPGRIEIRFRDHRAGRWKAVGGRRVRTVRI